MRSYFYEKTLFTGVLFVGLLFSCVKLNNIDNQKNGVEKKVSFNFFTTSVEQNEIITRESFLSLINDINLFVYDENGILSQHFYISNLNESPAFITNLKKISLYAVANWGSSLYSSQMIYSSELENLTFEYGDISSLASRNIFSGKNLFINIYDGININIELIRSFAKLTVCFDKSELNSDVNVSINQIAVKNSPSITNLFKEFYASNTSQINNTGELISDPVMGTQHYMAQPMLLAENMQGNLLAGNSVQSLKVLSEPMSSLCSYVEISASYRSSVKAGSVKYRIYLGKDEIQNFDIKRNTWYQLTLKLKGNTLNETSWRLVTDELKDFVTSINLTPENLDYNSLNTSKQITATILPTSAFNKTISWRSTNPLIASVSTSGVVTSVGYGSCKIIGTTNDGSGLSDTTNVNVVYYNPIILVSDIILSPSTISFIYLTTNPQTIGAVVLPADAANKTLAWQSSNNQVAIVTQTGIVTQMGIGNCTITAKSTDGSNIQKSINIAVNYASPTGIEIVEEYNQSTNTSKPAKTSLVDARLCDGVRAKNSYKIKVIPYNANQNVPVSWSLKTILNNPNIMATLSKQSDESAFLSAKDIINVATNRGELAINATALGFSKSLNVQIYEKIPLRFEWGIWLQPYTEEELEGIVVRYSSHNTGVAPLELPYLAVVGSSGIEYWGAQLGVLWVNPLLPTSYQEYLNEFSTAIIHPGSEYDLTNNCFYTIEH